MKEDDDSDHCDCDISSKMVIFITSCGSAGFLQVSLFCYCCATHSVQKKKSIYLIENEKKSSHVPSFCVNISCYSLNTCSLYMYNFFF